MEKTEKCYHYFIGLSILFGILFIGIFVRFLSGFEYPSEKELFEFLLYCEILLLLGFVISTSITIALKNILADIECKLISLKLKTEDLDKKLLNLQKDR